MLYLRIDPANITTEVVGLLEEDTTVIIHDFPFAKADIYKDGFDEKEKENLKDGFLYAVLPRQNTIFSSRGINTSILDTLYKPLNDEDSLVIQSLVDGGYITQQEADQRICFRRPEGFVRYRDSELGIDQPVMRIRVWAIAFGIPIHTYTDDNGWFRIGWRFLFGTIIGTKAVNNRVVVKPVITQGTLWPLVVIPQFIIGSVHVQGFRGSCALNSININFSDHGPNRFWSHVLNAVRFHDIFTQQDQILNAPQEITIWAQWADNYGGASAPMLGHIPNNPASLLVQYISGLFGTDITNYQNVFNVLIGGLPDITLRSGSFERVSYSSDQMQTAFHELGHANHYRVAGNNFWIDYIFAILTPNGSCQGYGCGGGSNDGLIRVGESWAEFIGTTYALRRYPNGDMRSVFFQTFGNPEGLVHLGAALEQEDWFVNTWIPTGIFNDLQDAANPFEPWDNVQGATIQQIFSVFDPDVRDICFYYNRFIALYSAQFGINPVQNVFDAHGYFCALQKVLIMRIKYFSIIVTFLVIMFSRCDPDRNTFGTYYALLKAEVNKTFEAIGLGDTLRFTLQLPDVLHTATLAGDTRTDNVSSLQEAWYAYRIFRVDTINNTVYSSSGEGAKVDFFLSEGYEIQPCQPCYVGTVYLQRSSKPFRGVLNIVPQVKGLFYLEIRPQAGAFKINNNFEGLLKVDFNVVNKHANLLTPYLTSWENVVQQRGQEGFGIYCFKVI